MIRLIEVIGIIDLAENSVQAAMQIVMYFQCEGLAIDINELIENELFELGKEYQSQKLNNQEQN